MATKKSWQVMPAKKIKPTAPSSTQSLLKEKANKLIEDIIKPKHVQSASITNDHNYIANIYSKWYRNNFYFCATHNCPSSNATYPSFETKFARMEYAADNKFNLAYMRYTGKWFEVSQDISMDECLKLIEEDPIFMP